MQIFVILCTSCTVLGS